MIRSFTDKRKKEDIKSGRETRIRITIQGKNGKIKLLLFFFGDDL